MKAMDTLLSRMDSLWSQLNQCRAYFPYMPDNAVGWTAWQTAPTYREKGFDVLFHPTRPLTAEDIEQINSAGEFINESYLVWLWALIESKAIASNKESINHSLPGAKELDILRRLRHKIGHAVGVCNPSNREGRALYNCMVKYFKLDQPKLGKYSPVTRYPSDIGKVLEPITKACKKYIMAYYNTPETAKIESIAQVRSELRALIDDVNKLLKKLREVLRQVEQLEGKFASDSPGRADST